MEILKRKRKRVLFPWISHKQGKIYKCYISIVCDNYNWSKMLNGKAKSRTIFFKYIYPKLAKAFPNMYTLVKKYYRERGRELSLSEFQNLVFLRFKCMYKWNIGNSKLTITREHPLHHNAKKIKKSYKKAITIFKENN